MAEPGSLRATSVLTPSSIDSSTGAITLGNSWARFTFSPADGLGAVAASLAGPAAAVARDAWTGVDLAVRPHVFGEQVFETVRAPTAATDFSWRVELPDRQELRRLDDRTVAVVVRPGPVPGPDVSPDANGLGEPVPSQAPAPSLAGTGLGPISSARAEVAADASPLVGDPTTQLQTGTAALRSASVAAGLQVTALIQAPWARDATGARVPTRLTVDGSEFTVHLSPGASAEYPLVGAQRFLTADGVSAGVIAGLAAKVADPRPAFRNPLLAQRAAAPAAAGYFQFGGFTGLATSQCAAVAAEDNIACSASQTASMLANNFLGIKLLRAVVTWNFQGNAREKARFDNWYRWAKSIPGHYIQVAFQGERPAPPDLATYLAGVRGLLMDGDGPVGDPDHYAEVATVSAWNEPNVPRPVGSSTYASPDAVLATQYLAVDAYVCALTKRCSVVAGDFSGEPGDYYISIYPFVLSDQYPDFRPAVWGFHAWTDVNRYMVTSNQTNPNRSAPATHWVDAAIANWAASQGIAMPSLWNTETGSNYKLACKTSQGKDTAVTPLCAWNTGPGLKLNWPDVSNPTYFFMMPVQAKGAGFALQLANVDPSHIQALIYYRYSDRGGTSEPDLFAPPDDPFGPNSDFSAPGQRRPVYCVIRDRITVDDPRLPPRVGC